MFSAGKDRLAVGATFDHGQDRLLGLLHGHHRADLGLNSGSFYTAAARFQDLGMAGLSATTYVVGASRRCSNPLFKTDERLFDLIEIVRGLLCEAGVLAEWINLRRPNDLRDPYVARPLPHVPNPGTVEVPERVRQHRVRHRQPKRTSTAPLHQAQSAVAVTRDVLNPHFRFERRTDQAIIAPDPQEMRLSGAPRWRASIERLAKSPLPARSCCLRPREDEDGDRDAGDEAVVASSLS